MFYEEIIKPACVPVTMESIYHANNGSIDLIEGHKAINVDGSVNAIMSDKYKLFHNRDMLDAVMNGINASGLDTTDMDLKIGFDGKRTLANFMLPAHRVEMDSGDTVFRIVAKNSYTGTWTFSLLAGGFRIACANGQIVGDYVDAYSSKHTQEIDTDKISQRILTMHQSFVDEGPRWISYAKTPLSFEEGTNQVMDYLNVKDRDVVIEDLSARVGLRKLHDLWVTYYNEMGGNYFALYNAFTHFSTHGANKNGNVVSLANTALRERRLNVIQKNWPVSIAA